LENVTRELQRCKLEAASALHLPENYHVVIYTREYSLLSG